MISIVLCTYNRAKMLERTLQSLGEMVVPPGLAWELIVVDNNSSDDTREVIEGFKGKGLLPLQYIFEGRQGHTVARNTAIGAARGEILIFTDDDVTVDNNWLAQYRDAFERFECIGAGGKIIPVLECEKPPWLVTEGPYKLIDVAGGFDQGAEPCDLTMKTTPYGANLGFRKIAFEKYGLFRADLGPSGNYPMAGGETEFCRRVLRAGERLVYVPKAIVHHFVEKERITKGYFQRRYFSFGRSQVRVFGVPEGAVRYFGVPRYLIRSLAQQLSKWLLALDAQRRSYHKLQVVQVAGQIYEARRASPPAEKAGEGTGGDPRREQKRAKE